MESKEKKGIKIDLMRHPEHLCSITLSSCGAEDRARVRTEQAAGKGPTGRAEDICTPLFTGA